MVLNDIIEQAAGRQSQTPEQGGNVAFSPASPSSITSRVFLFFFLFFCLFSFCSSLLQMCIIMWLPSILPFRCTLWFKIISHRTYSSLALIYLAEPFSEPRAAFCTYIADERSSFLFFSFLFSFQSQPTPMQRCEITIRVLYLISFFFPSHLFTIWAWCVNWCGSPHTHTHNEQLNEYLNDD